MAPSVQDSSNATPGHVQNARIGEIGKVELGQLPRVQSNDNLTEALWFYHLIIVPRVRAILLSSISVEERIQ